MRRGSCGVGTAMRNEGSWGASVEDGVTEPPRKCPFCGSEPELQVREKVGGGWLALVRCPACQACGPYVTGNECLSGLQMLAWHQWNRRSL